MKRVMAFISMILISALVFAQVPSEKEMYDIFQKRFNEYNFIDDMRCMTTFIKEEPNSPKSVSQFQMFRRDSSNQTCIVQLAPEVDKGNGYLQDNDNVWVYDPISHQFTHSSIKQNISDSDTKLSDLTKKDEFRDYYKILKIEEGKLGKFPVYIVTLKTISSDAAYAQEKHFIRKDNHLALKIESYGASGKHMRTTLFPKYVEHKGTLVPVQQIMINELVKGEKTTMLLTDINTSKIPDMVFTKAYLEKIN